MDPSAERILPSLEGHAIRSGNVVQEHQFCPARKALSRHGHDKRVGACYGQDDYVNSGCDMGREATLYLLECGVRVTGTDGWSWEAPFVYTAERYRQTGTLL